MKIITTVGASLVDNSGVNCDDLKNRELDVSEFEANNIFFKKFIFSKEEELLKYAKKEEERASAELASLKKIDPGGEAEILLFCTETFISYMCGRVIQRYYGKRANVKIIKGLQVENLERFQKEGVPNLLFEIEAVAQNGLYWKDVALNVTGGYKAIIPIISIIGQIKRLKTFYIFKGDEDRRYELIEMPRMPVDFQMDIFEQYWEDFMRFGEEAKEMLSIDSLSEGFFNNCGSCLQVEDGFAWLNPVGYILWKNYAQRFFFLQTTDEVLQEINHQHDISRVLQTKFCNPEIRKSKTEQKKDHFVFDDGNNNNRIYYFEQNGKMYVYCTFENEEKAKAYINKPFTEKDRIEFAQKSKSFRLQIQR